MAQRRHQYTHFCGTTWEFSQEQWEYDGDQNGIQCNGKKSETPRSPLLSQCKQKYIIVLYIQYIYILYSLLCMVIITLVSYGSKHFIRIYLDPQRLILLVVHGAKKELCCTVFFTPPCRTQSRFPFTKFGVQQFIPSLLGSDQIFFGAAIMIMPVYRDGTKPPIPYFRGC